MKKMKMFGLGLAFCLMTAMVLAEAQERQRPNARTRSDASAARTTRPTTGRGTLNREEVYKRMLADRMKTHQAGIDELMAIKKVAEEEEATRTAAAVQSLIDKKNKSFQDSMTQMEKRRRAQAEKMSQRQSQIGTRKIDDDDDDKKEQPTVRPSR